MMLAHRRFFVVLVLGFVLIAMLPATTSAFNLSTSLDVGLGVGSLALVGGNLLREKGSSFPVYSGTPKVPLEGLNLIDRAAVFPFNSTLDKVGTLATVGLLAVPGVYALVQGEGMWGYGLMYLETVAMTYGVKELLKNSVARERPYLYNEGYPTEELSNGDYCRSFPSGHTALAFASAAFLTTVMSLDDEDFQWRIPVSVGSFALAAGIAATRVMSGNHFVTDVLAGALLGAVCGVGVPLLHTLVSGRSFSVGVAPMGVSFGMRY